MQPSVGMTQFFSSLHAIAAHSLPVYWPMSLLMVAIGPRQVLDAVEHELKLPR